MAGISQARIRYNLDDAFRGKFEHYGLSVSHYLPVVADQMVHLSQELFPKSVRCFGRRYDVPNARFLVEDRFGKGAKSQLHHHISNPRFRLNIKQDAQYDRFLMHW